METVATTFIMIGTVNFFFGLTLMCKDRAKEYAWMYLLVGVLGLMAAIFICHGNVLDAFTVYKQPGVNKWFCGIVSYIAFIGMLFLEYHKKNKKLSGSKNK